MVCVYCGSKTQVTNSRPQVKRNHVWRRRQCVACAAMFTTEEAPEYDLAWVVQRAGSFEPFSRDTLFLSLYTCCEHREHALRDAKGLTETVMSKLAGLIIPDTARTLASHDIARVALVALSRLDSAAAVRYQALHPYL